MPQSLILFITHYGYAAIFALVFLQEIGIPNPITNELVLLFAGSLGYSGVLSFPLIFLSAVTADIIGTTLLYWVFYTVGPKILAKKWIPISQDSIAGLIDRVEKHGSWGIFIGRMLPLVRGYASVAAGLLHIKPKKFLLSVIASAIVWTGGYVLLGRILGKYWLNAQYAVKGIQKGVLLLLIVAIIIFGGRYLVNKLTQKKVSK
ncbi:MAG: DedA family protein [Candidatus Paceibacterota bacterium]